ncbi:MAG: hypothetical protein U1F68_06545 [Gammaproteobacteria bacterium]
MKMIVPIGILALCLGLFFVLLHRRKRERGAADSNTEDGSKTASQVLEEHFGAAMLMPPASGVYCNAMAQLIGCIYSVSDKPTVPLPGCDIQLCHCRFQYLPERRKVLERRRTHDRRQNIRFELGRIDRRSGRDRRRTNQIWSGRDH